VEQGGVLTVKVSKKLAVAAFSAATAFAASVSHASADPVQYPDGSLRFSATGTTIPTVYVQTADVCDIMLEPGERIRQAIISDSVRWKLTDGTSAADTPHIFVKPTEPGIRALLTVTTTRRVYHVRLFATRDSGEEFVAFYYPKVLERLEAVGSRPRPAPTTPPAYACAPPLDTAYRVFGANEFRPRSICNDGAHTYLNMGRIDGNLPVLVVIGDDGHDQIGNFSFDNDHLEYVIDGVPKKLALLRNGGRGQLRVNIERGTAK